MHVASLGYNIISSKATSRIFIKNGYITKILLFVFYIMLHVTGHWWDQFHRTLISLYNEIDEYNLGGLDPRSNASCKQHCSVIRKLK